MIQLDSKLPDVGVTIFTVMSQLANHHQAINLSQGFPDFDTDPDLIQRVIDYMKKGNNQYAAITAVVRTGDEVIIFEPAYDAYAPVVRLNNGIPVFLQLKPPDYRIDWDEVADSLSDRTRLIILNSPHNPTGSVLQKSDMAALEAILDSTEILILSDEVYEHIVFDRQIHESIIRYPGLAARSYVVSSFGKTYHTKTDHNVVRFCFAKKVETLERAAEKLCRI